MAFKYDNLFMRRGVAIFEELTGIQLIKIDKMERYD
jgi:hypothetical protein